MNFIFADTFGKPKFNNALTDDDFVRMLVISLFQDCHPSSMPVNIRCSCSNAADLPPLLYAPQNKYHCMDCYLLNGGRHKRHDAVRNAVIELIKTYAGNTIGMIWPTPCYFATAPNKQTQTIAIDFIIVNQSGTTYSHLDTATFLANRGQCKIDKYRRANIPEGVSFVPFVISTSGVLGVRANALLNQLNQRSIICDIKN